MDQILKFYDADSCNLLIKKLSEFSRNITEVTLSDNNKNYFKYIQLLNNDFNYFIKLIETIRDSKFVSNKSIGEKSSIMINNFIIKYKDYLTNSDKNICGNTQNNEISLKEELTNINEFLDKHKDKIEFTNNIMQNIYYYITDYLIKLDENKNDIFYLQYMKLHHINIRLYFKILSQINKNNKNNTLLTWFLSYIKTNIYTENNNKYDHINNININKLKKDLSTQKIMLLQNICDDIKNTEFFDKSFHVDYVDENNYNMMECYFIKLAKKYDEMTENDNIQYVNVLKNDINAIESSIDKMKRIIYKSIFKQSPFTKYV